MVSIAVALGSPAYSSERAFTALNFVKTSVMEGHEVRMFIFEDGVFLAKQGQDPGNFANAQEMLGSVVESGVEVRLCGTCCKERGMMVDDLIDGVSRGGMPDFVAMVAGSDRSVVF